MIGAQPSYSGKPGRIIQISSVSGRIATPFLGSYCGSKFALEAISDSLRRELMLFGIKVILIEPGPVKTPIYDKADSDEIEVKYGNSPYAKSIGIFRSKFKKQASEHGFESEWLAT